jgi:hypothetical protein
MESRNVPCMTYGVAKVADDITPKRVRNVVREHIEQSHAFACQLQNKKRLKNFHKSFYADFP